MEVDTTPSATMESSDTVTRKSREEESTKKSNIMTKGCSVVLQKGEYLKVGKLLNQNSVKLGKDTVILDQLDGHLFGTYFRLVPANVPKRSGRTFTLVKIDGKPSSGIDALQPGKSGEDNRFIIEDKMAQKLDQEAIESLRDKGISGTAIVEQLADNSKTFEQKTEFSQEKWLRKKKEKHLDYVIAWKPSIRLLATTYYVQGPNNILNFRYDSLAQLLCQCDVRSGGRYAVFDTGTHGLLAAGVLDRLRGRGQLLWLFDGEQQKHALNSMNFSAEETSCMWSLNIHLLKDFLDKEKPIENPKPNGNLECDEEKAAAVENKDSKQMETNEAKSSTTKEQTAEESVQKTAVPTEQKPVAPEKIGENVQKTASSMKQETSGGSTKRKLDEMQEKPQIDQEAVKRLCDNIAQMKRMLPDSFNLKALLSRVYVGNLSYEVTEEYLKQEMSYVGPVVSVSMSHKGYAFVQYAEPVYADAALRKMHKYLLLGNRRITVGRPSQIGTLLQQHGIPMDTPYNVLLNQEGHHLKSLIEETTESACGNHTTDDLPSPSSMDASSPEVKKLYEKLPQIASFVKNSVNLKEVMQTLGTNQLAWKVLLEDYSTKYRAETQKREMLQSMSRIVVQGLGSDVTRQTLFESFSPFGPIDSLSMDFRGKASIAFEVPDAACLALEQMNGVFVGSRPITLHHGYMSNHSRSMKLSLETQSQQRFRVYISSVHPSVSVEDVKSTFSEFGSLKSCQLAALSEDLEGHKGYGYVEFESAESCVQALDNMSFSCLGGQFLRTCRSFTPLEDLYLFGFKPTRDSLGTECKNEIAQYYDLVKPGVVDHLKRMLHFCKERVPANLTQEKHDLYEETLKQMDREDECGMEERDCKMESQGEKDCKMESSEEKDWKMESSEEKDWKMESSEEKDCKIESSEEKDCKMESSEEKDWKMESSEEKDCKMESQEENKCHKENSRVNDSPASPSTIAKSKEVERGEKILGGKLDGLLIACKQHPLNILQAILPFLKLSSTFGVFCPYQEPLVECFFWLKRCGFAVNVRISETWLRSYQVLPDRTHPLVGMSGGGGYLLTGTYVEV